VFPEKQSKKTTKALIEKIIQCLRVQYITFVYAVSISAMSTKLLERLNNEGRRRCSVHRWRAVQCRAKWARLTGRGRPSDSEEQSKEGSIVSEQRRHGLTASLHWFAAAFACLCRCLYSSGTGPIVEACVRAKGDVRKQLPSLQAAASLPCSAYANVTSLQIREFWPRSTPTPRYCCHNSKSTV
jgi:hypothetical protein